MMKEWQKTRDVAGYPHSQILRGLIALRSTDSFAPSELRFFTTNTQGSAKPPPWAKFLDRLRRVQKNRVTP